MGARSPAECDEIAPGEQWWRDEGLGRGGKFGAFLLKKLVVIQQAVGAEAIDPMEGEFVFDVGAGKEALERGGAHLLDANEVHVIGDSGGGGFDDIVRILEAAEDPIGHLGTEFVVTVEADATAIGIDGLGGWFGDVVKQNGEYQRQRGIRRQEGKHEPGVNENVSLWVELRRLLAAFEGEDLRQKVCHETAIHEEVKAALAMGGEPDAVEFVANAFGADLGDEGSAGLDG